MICRRCQAELDPALGMCPQCGSAPASANVIDWRDHVRESVKRRREQRAQELGRRDAEARQLSIFGDAAETALDSAGAEKGGERARHAAIRARVERRLAEPRVPAHRSLRESRGEGGRRARGLVDAGEVAISGRADTALATARAHSEPEGPPEIEFRRDEVLEADRAPADAPSSTMVFARPSDRLLAGLVDFGFIASLLLGLAYVTTNMIGRPLRGLPASSLAALGCVGFFITVGYFVLFWGLSGQTLGGLLSRHRVVDRLGRPPGLGRAALRLFGIVLAVVPAGAGLVGLFTDHERRGWHDRIAATRVVQ